MIFQLDPNHVGFPDPQLGEKDGLLALGGALTPNWLLTAYSHGIFPWYGFKESNLIQWWCPMERFVIFPEEIHISHSMEQLIRQRKYRCSVDEAFDDVIRNCSTAQERLTQTGAWLGNDMITAYSKLHDMGYALSIEVWDGKQLVGGLYGVCLGNSFFGESMFSLVPNASKLALIFLATLMNDSGGLIDCQFETAHLKSMGGRTISYEHYMSIISKETD